jgi:tRNA(fMet)-specific endonuclease VapC
MMFVLDTDYMSLLERPTTPISERLRDRLAEIDAERRSTTIISFEEQVRGWMDYLSKAQTIAKMIEAYRRLRVQLENYCRIQILDFDELSATRYQELRKQRIKVGSMDLRIAAIVISRDATLLSRNLKDFRRVPGLRVEDWTA